MAGYMPAQSLLKTLLLTCASFDTGDVTEGDYRAMDQGRTNIAVITPGSLPEFGTTELTRWHTYDAMVDLFSRWDDFTAYNDFGTLRDAVLSTVNAAPCLDETYSITGIASEGNPTEVYDKQGAGPFFMTQRLRFTIQEWV